MKLAVVIPCLNEENSIAQTILSVQQMGLDADIYVIDNGSTDRTAQIARKHSAYVLREPQKGKGFALRRGITGIPDIYDVYFMVDGDDTYEISPIIDALALIEDGGFDMVIGRRVSDLEKNAGRSSGYRFGHVLGNKLLTYSFRFLFKLEITDTLSGWRVMSRPFVRSFSGGASGFDIEAELNAHCQTLSAAVTEVQVKYRGRLENSASKLRTYKDGLIILRKNLRLFRSERPLLAYSLMSAPWLSAGILLSNRVFQTYLEIRLVPQFPSLIAAVGFFVIACNLWVTGMILEKTRQTRVSISRLYFSQHSRFQ